MSSKAGGKGVSGKLDQDLMAELLADDFDPEEYDRRMAAAFDEEYYGVSWGGGAS